MLRAAAQLETQLALHLDLVHLSFELVRHRLALRVEIFVHEHVDIVESLDWDDDFWLVIAHWLLYYFLLWWVDNNWSLDLRR